MKKVRQAKKRRLRGVQMGMDVHNCCHDIVITLVLGSMGFGRKAVTTEKCVRNSLQFAL